MDLRPPWAQKYSQKEANTISKYSSTKGSLLKSEYADLPSRIFKKLSQTECMDGQFIMDKPGTIVTQLAQIMGRSWPQVISSVWHWTC